MWLAFLLDDYSFLDDLQPPVTPSFVPLCQKALLKFSISHGSFSFSASHVVFISNHSLSVCSLSSEPPPPKPMPLQSHLLPTCCLCSSYTNVLPSQF